MLQLEDRRVVFPPIIASNTSKITPKSTTAAISSVRRIGIVVHRTFATFALCKPITNLKILSSRQPIHPTLFRSPWHPFELFAVACHAFGALRLLSHLHTMIGIPMPAEAQRCRTYATTFSLLRVTPVGDINP